MISVLVVIGEQIVVSEVIVVGELVVIVKQVVVGDAVLKDECAEYVGRKMQIMTTCFQQNLQA